MQVIAEPLRDRAVLSLLQASLEGLQRVLLDGGPLRAFSAADGELLEEDLTVLKVRKRLLFGWVLKLSLERHDNRRYFPSRDNGRRIGYLYQNLLRRLTTQSHYNVCICGGEL